MIAIKSRIRKDTLRLERLILGIEIAILQILVQLAVELVAAALHDGVELAAGGMAVLGLKLILKQCEFGNGFTGHERVRSRDVFSIIVDALDGEVIVPRALTADRRTRTNSDAAGAGDACLQQRHVDHANANRVGGQIGDIFRAIRGLNLRRRGIDDGSGVADINRRRD